MGNAGWGRRVLVGALAVVFGTMMNGAAGWAQTAAVTGAAAAPEFEVATIKPVKEPDPSNMRDREDGRRFSTQNTTLRNLIMLAYEVDLWQIAGGPAWVATDEYDVDAVAGDERQLDEHWQAMLQKLLADRFQLAFHREQREMPLYVLEIAKGGPKLKASAPNGQQSSGCERLGVCNFKGYSLAHFARWMGFVVLDKPLVDKTGIAGEFDFRLSWTPDETQFSNMGFHVSAPAGDNPNAPPELFTAIQEQLGLKLEPQKTQAEVLVIDHVERPSEN
jgi:uncharacterized protein (TIGR03435 family)